MRNVRDHAITLQQLQIWIERKLGNAGMQLMPTLESTPEHWMRLLFHKENSSLAYMIDVSCDDTDRVVLETTLRAFVDTHTPMVTASG